MQICTREGSVFNTRVAMPNHPNSWGAVEFNSLFPAYPLFNYRQGLTSPVCFRHLCGSYFEGRPRRSRQLLHCSSERVGCQNQFFDCFVLVSKHTLDRRATSIVRYVLAPHHGQAIRGDLFDYYVGSFGVFQPGEFEAYLLGGLSALARSSVQNHDGFRKTSDETDWTLKPIGFACARLAILSGHHRNVSRLDRFQIKLCRVGYI